MRYFLYTLKTVIRRLLVFISIIAAIAIFITSAIPFGKKAYEYFGYSGMVVGYVSGYYENPDIKPSFLENLGQNKEKPEIKYPVISYMVGDEKYEHKGIVEVGSYPYQTGIQMNIRYNPYNPDLSGYDLEMQSAYIKFAASVALSLSFVTLSVFLTKSKPKHQYNEFDTEIKTETTYETNSSPDPVSMLSKKVKKKKEPTKKLNPEVDNSSNWENSGDFKSFEDILHENIRKQE